MSIVIGSALFAKSRTDGSYANREPINDTSYARNVTRANLPEVQMEQNPAASIEKVKWLLHEPSLSSLD